MQPSYKTCSLLFINVGTVCIVVEVLVNGAWESRMTCLLIIYKVVVGRIVVNRAGKSRLTFEAD